MATTTVVVGSVVLMDARLVITDSRRSTVAGAGGGVAEPFAD